MAFLLVSFVRCPFNYNLSIPRLTLAVVFTLASEALYHDLQLLYSLGFRKDLAELLHGARTVEASSIFMRCGLDGRHMD